MRWFGVLHVPEVGASLAKRPPRNRIAAALASALPPQYARGRRQPRHTSRHDGTSGIGSFWLPHNWRATLRSLR